MRFGYSSAPGAPSTAKTLSPASRRPSKPETKGEQVHAFFLGFTARDSMPTTRARRSPAHPKQHLPTDCLGGPRAPKSAAMRPQVGTPPELSWFFVAGRGVLSERGSLRVSPKGWRPG